MQDAQDEFDAAHAHLSSADLVAMASRLMPHPKGYEPIQRAKSAPVPAAPVDPTPRKRKVKVVRDEDGAITGFETE